MIDVGSVEKEINSLKNTYFHGRYEYHDPSDSFRICTLSHFDSISFPEKYGVYIIRNKGTNEIVYIGKSGTITREGKYKGQNMVGRLTNTRGDTPSNRWFSNLCIEIGSIIVEYIFLPTSKSPAFVESTLLQAYLNEHHCLPLKNKSL